MTADQFPDDIQQEIDDQTAAQDAAMAEVRYHERVTSAMERLRIDQDARRRLARADRADLERPTLVRLDKLLARQYDTPTYRIRDLWPTGGRMLLAAQWKAGKSTLVGNLVRALVDGDQFLGKYLPRQAESVVLIDDELDERTLQLWFREQHITNADRVHLLPLRGRVAAFDILDPDSRAEWAKDLTGHDVALLDCLRPIFDAFGLDENHEAGRFLVALDALLADAGVDECGVVHHMGHGPERSRGDSRLLDWPDATWKIVRDKDDEDEHGMDDPAGSRYFSAYGRDVDVPQAELLYDRATRRLEIGTKTRHQAVETRKMKKADQAVLAAVAASPGVNKTGLRKLCRAYGTTNNEAIDEAVERLVVDGLMVRVMSGQQRLHYPADGPQGAFAAPTVPNHAQSELGTVNDGLTWDDPPTVPNRAQNSVGIIPNQDESKSPMPTDAHPFQNPPGHGADHPAQNPLGVGRGRQAHPTVPKPLGTVPCPHCDLNKIPADRDMCDECAERLHLEDMPDD